MNVKCSVASVVLGLSVAFPLSLIAATATIEIDTEAAFITGLWRNADVVTMGAYAPLFAKVGHVQRWASTPPQVRTTTQARRLLPSRIRAPRL